jgi:membrane-associated protein
VTDSLTETLLALVPVHGAWLVGAITFASCLALPVPSSLALLAAGAFAATGDLSLFQVGAAALGGAVLGDQTGYLLGRRGAGWVARATHSPPRASLMAKARDKLAHQALATVFLTRWLFSPLGPWVNLAAGATHLNWRRFAIGSVTGEAVWVALYIGLGWAFAAQVDRMGALLGNAGAALLALLGTVVLARALWRAHTQSP